MLTIAFLTDFFNESMMALMYDEWSNEWSNEPQWWWWWWWWKQRRLDMQTTITYILCSFCIRIIIISTTMIDTGRKRERGNHNIFSKAISSMSIGIRSYHLCSLLCKEIILHMNAVNRVIYFKCYIFLENEISHLNFIV